MGKTIKKQRNKYSRTSLKREVDNILRSKSKFGIKKSETENSNKYIFSIKTFEAYKKQCTYFVEWCKENHQCKSVQECRQYTEEYMETRRTNSAWSQKQQVCALAKMYGCKSKYIAPTPIRQRGNIQRSRFKTQSDKYFNEAKHYDLVEFAKSTGLRRNELKNLKTTSLYYDKDEGLWMLKVTDGTKANKPREVEIIGNIEHVKEMFARAVAEPNKDNHVFKTINTHADIHHYRAVYANRIYENYKRPIDEIPF